MTSSAIAAMDMMPCYARLPTQSVWREEFWTIEINPNKMTGVEQQIGL
jgi:hypothetical protein